MATTYPFYDEQMSLLESLGGSVGTPSASMFATPAPPASQYWNPSAQIAGGETGGYWLPAEITPQIGGGGYAHNDPRLKPTWVPTPAAGVGSGTGVPPSGFLPQAPQVPAPNTADQIPNAINTGNEINDYIVNFLNQLIPNREGNESQSGANISQLLSGNVQSDALQRAAEWASSQGISGSQLAGTQGVYQTYKDRLQQMGLGSQLLDQQYGRQPKPTDITPFIITPAQQQALDIQRQGLLIEEQKLQQQLQIARMQNDTELERITVAKLNALGSSRGGGGRGGGGSGGRAPSTSATSGPGLPDFNSIFFPDQRPSSYDVNPQYPTGGSGPLNSSGHFNDPTSTDFNYGYGDEYPNTIGNPDPFSLESLTSGPDYSDLWLP